MVPAFLMNIMMGGYDCDGNIYNFTGLLLSDFETGVNPEWEIYVQCGQNMSFNIVNDAAQSNSFFDMGGSLSWDMLIGLIDFPAAAYGNYVFDLNDNSDEVYFNVMLNMPENLNPPIVLFQFKEDDNNNGVFEYGLVDIYSRTIEDLEPGWQLISFKYSDTGAGTNSDGNGIRNPNLLNMVSVLMLAPSAGGYSQVFMDYLIFTKNAPLNPPPF